MLADWSARCCVSGQGCGPFLQQTLEEPESEQQGTPAVLFLLAGGLPHLPPKVLFFTLSGGQPWTELQFFCAEEAWGLEALVHSGRPGSVKAMSSDGKSKGEWCSFLSGDQLVG